MKIPAQFSELIMECPECAYRETPDMILGHLVEEHHNSVSLAEEAIQNWMDAFELDGKGHALGECEFHGTYRLMDGCGGCERADRDIDEWKERRAR